jgi:hypothetical protein
MNDNAPIPNVALRAHVTDHSFVLTMRKTHIETLTEIAGGERKFGGNFITPVRGLQARGLVVHKHKPNFRGKSSGSQHDLITDYYRLTRAGWAVYDLLVEAGLAPAIEAKSAARKLVA